MVYFTKLNLKALDVNIFHLFYKNSFLKYHLPFSNSKADKNNLFIINYLFYKLIKNKIENNLIIYILIILEMLY